MTFEQENAMKAILMAVNDALRAGLTKGKIISEIENEGMHGFQRSHPQPILRDDMVGPLWLVKIENSPLRTLLKLQLRKTAYSDLRIHQPYTILVGSVLAMPGILIADDNSNIRYLLRVFVETKTPFKVCGEAVNGTDTIEKAKQLLPELIMLDYSMPLMTGIEAASVLKRMLPQTKILLFSLHADDLPKSLISISSIDLAVSKGEALVGLAERLQSLMEPSPLELPAPAVDILPTGSEIQTTTDKPTPATFKTDA